MKNPFRKETVGIGCCGGGGNVEEFRNGWLLLFIFGVASFLFVALMWKIAGGW